jgi:hypothetical protein
MNTHIEVQIISAPWCKRCGTIKPDVARYCALNGAVLTVVDYEEELDEKEKEGIKSLPTIRMKRMSEVAWSIYTADTIEAWKTDIVKLAPADQDF